MYRILKNMPECGLEQSGIDCDRSTACNVHPVWMNVQSQVRGILDKVTLKELAEG